MKASEIITKIVKEKQCYLIRHRKEDHVKGTDYNYDVKEAFTGKKRGWQYIDLFTASAMLQVHTALSDKVKIKFNTIPFMGLINLTWKVCK